MDFLNTLLINWVIVKCLKIFQSKRNLFKLIFSEKKCTVYFIATFPNIFTISFCNLYTLKYDYMDYVILFNLF